MRMLRIGCVAFTVIILIIVIGFATYMKFGLPWNYIEQKALLEQAAEEKYGLDFTMDRVVFALGHGGEYYGYLADDNDVRFYVGFEEGRFVDSYPMEKWAAEISDELVPIIRAHFPEAQLVVANVASNQYLKDVGHEIPSYKETVSVEVGATLKDVVVTDVEAELDRIWLMLKAVEATGAKVGIISINFANKTLQHRGMRIVCREELDGLLKDYQ
ncbi:hypothetical protein [Solibacillus sp. CAU 1738]|uniref:hypothetical protein n=1 Tax=Solibacillus sp. CAU 1738 TaxID=3140363 RepID=UPI0032611E78